MREAKTSLYPILAVDFDGTLVKNQFPFIGEINRNVWDCVVQAQKNGYKLILWTCRNGKALQDAVEFCSVNGIHFDAINENIDEVKVLYGCDTRKVFADMYIDDRCGVLTRSGEFLRIPVEQEDV